MNKKTFITALTAVILSFSAGAQINLSRLVQGAAKAIQAANVSDEQIQAYVKEYIDKTDAQNKIAGPDTEYGKRLAKLTSGLTDVEGIPLNFKVYITDQVNAFACADGSVRVYSGLMDVMNDNQVLGVIGHEMGHVAHKDTKNAFKQALLNSALRDGIAGASSKIGALTDSQLGDLGAALASSKYSKKQENNADDYGYQFLKEHGKNPVAMAQSFEKLQELEARQGATSNFINNLFSDHPELGSRIERMKKKAIADGYLDAMGNIVPEKDPETIARLQAEKEAKATKSSKTTKKKSSSKSTKKATKTKSKSTKKK